MSKSYVITGTRFQRLYKAEALTSSYAASSDAATIATNLCDVKWVESDARTALFPMHGGKTANDEANINNRGLFDAAMFCAEHDVESGRHRAYAQAACYRFTIPETGLTLQSLTAAISCDPYTPDGARVAIFTSDDATPPMKCVICRTGTDAGTAATTTASDSDGDGVNDTWTTTGRYADHVAPRRVVTPLGGSATWYVGTGNVVFNPTGGVALSKYLFVFVLLENYNTSRSGYLEGSSYIQPKISITLNNAVASWDALIAAGKTSVDCADAVSAITFPVLLGGVPPVVDPTTCEPIHFRDNVSEVPFSDDCLPSPETVKQYTPPGEFSLTVMEEGGLKLTDGTYPWAMSSLFVNDPAGMRTEGFSGGVKQESGPAQLVYYLRDLFSITYHLSRFPFFNSTAKNLMDARRNLDGSYPYIVQPGGGVGGHGDIMYGDEDYTSYYLPPSMNGVGLPATMTGRSFLFETAPVNLYSPFSDVTHKGALALGGRLSSIHCAYNKGDTNSPINAIAPGVRILVASFSEGSVTHGDNSEYFEFVDNPLILGSAKITATDAYTMLNGGTATRVFVGDPLGPDDSLDTENHNSFFVSLATALGTAAPNSTAAFLKDLCTAYDTYSGVAYDLDHNGGLPFTADYQARYRSTYPYDEIYDGGYLPDPTMSVHMYFGSLPHYDCDEFFARDYFDTHTSYNNLSVDSATVTAMHDPTVYQIHVVKPTGSSVYTPSQVRRYSSDGWQYKLWQYAKGGNLVAHFRGQDPGPHSISHAAISTAYGSSFGAGESLLASVVYPIFVTNGTATKLLAFLRLVTRRATDVVAYPKSSDTNIGAYSLSTVSAETKHNITMCFMKDFTATYAQIWAPPDSLKSTDFGGCTFLRYPNMLNDKAVATRYTYDTENGTITPLSSLDPLMDPVSWANNTANNTCSITYATHTISGTGKIFGVCKVPVKYDSYVYLFGSFTSFGGVPCKNVVKVYFTSSGPVAQNVKWDSMITPSDGSEESSQGSETTDPVYFELAPEAVCGTGPEFSSRLVMYGNFVSVGEVATPNHMAVIDPADSTITPLGDPMHIGFSDKSYLMNADSTSGICAFLNSNGNVAQVRDVTVYPEEIPWSRTVKTDSGALGIRNCYAKFYEGAVSTSPAYVTYATGPVFLVGHVKKFARKWASSSNGQEIVPGHVPVWRILCAPMCIPFSLPGGTRCKYLDLDWSGVVLSGEVSLTDEDEANPGTESSSDSESSESTVEGYSYPIGYDTTSKNVASLSRYAECTKGTLFRIWLNTKKRFVTVPDEVSRDPAFYDGSKSVIGDWVLVGTIDPYDTKRSVTFDVSAIESYTGSIAMTAWYPADKVDVTKLGRGYVGSGYASDTSMLHAVPTVGYGFVPDITFRR